jgi:hypothetical protein
MGSRPRFRPVVEHVRSSRPDILALAAFSVLVDGRVCLELGAAAGGFTAGHRSLDWSMCEGSRGRVFRAGFRGRKDDDIADLVQWAVRDSNPRRAD